MKKPGTSLLTFAALIGITAFTLAFLKNRSRKLCCQRPDSCQKTTQPKPSGGSAEPLEAGFNHLIVSTLR